MTLVTSSTVRVVAEAVSVMLVTVNVGVVGKLSAAPQEVQTIAAPARSIARLPIIRVFPTTTAAQFRSLRGPRLPRAHLFQSVSTTAAAEHCLVQPRPGRVYVWCEAVLRAKVHDASL